MDLGLIDHRRAATRSAMPFQLKQFYNGDIDRVQNSDHVNTSSLWTLWMFKGANPALYIPAIAFQLPTTIFTPSNQSRDQKDQCFLEALSFTIHIFALGV